MKMVIKIYKLKKSITLKTLKERNDIKNEKKLQFLYAAVVLLNASFKFERCFHEEAVFAPRNFISFSTIKF